MKKVNCTKLFSLMLISILLFWNVFPLVGLAGSFITPGTPIKPGQAISPGDPISGGDFLIPGDVFQPGDAINPGDSYNDGKNISSGTPILENFPLTNGTFIIPNAPPLPPNFVFGGDSFTPGDPISPGDPSGAGETSSGNVDGNGKAIEGGDPGSNGKAVEGGDPNGDGKAVEGGDPDGDGNAIEGGNPDGNGNAVEGGDPGGNGNAVEGGDPDGNGTGFEGGDPDASGNSVKNGNPGGEGNTSEGTAAESNPSVLNLFVSSTDTSRGPAGFMVGLLKDYKRYGLSFFDKIAQAGASYYAGFNFKDLGNGKYSVYGKNKLNNKISDWFYQRYKTYKFDGNEAHFGPNSRHIGKSRFDSFFESKSIGGGAGFWGNTKNSLVKSLNESWNPASKSFWKFSNSLKLGGPVNAVLSSFNSIYDYGFGDDPIKRSKGIGSTDFAATLTTDVAIGVGSTAIGSVASSMAAGALAGSAVPVVGTAVGAVVGLGAGLTTTYLINGTATGRRLKAGATKLIKNAYDGGVDLAKKGAKAVSDGVSSAFKRIGGLFG
ncbi:hypothetical protein [Rossellomorea aquimaris]|jgi:hypothetical protein|uniref:Uncharacterized protein n=1 Tax=Rossellomorea aquimaris TaxID=189382 RepID=A0A1J6W526_9BACI|nr:hypothetical protein [Rossellomorea aquimaris]OIU72682.1 hypothetical protein BHE18_21320 [Rossellomorea aquimaris]